ncbi:hypothetical protein ACQR1W_26435 [Bradyrhizobium sp. HKCCYLS1011]|uniref:hypothetical protein n=1 Tax=Bradyrhizobium sp. HKCCYLS1011 TaxID=3420733 RepID=UPI003EBC9A95
MNIPVHVFVVGVNLIGTVTIALLTMQLFSLRRNAMKFVEAPPYATPEAAARKLMEIARPLKPVQDRRPHIEKVNRPMLGEFGATPAEYQAGLDYAIAQGWLWLHESGTYVEITEMGAELFAIDAQET